MSTAGTERRRLVRFRARAMHLDARLPPGSLAHAASGGLQDSAPRTGSLSLHARVEDAGPDAWDDPALAQVWGPRMAVYIVPRADVDVFTLGRMPRDPDKRARIDEAADQILRALDARERSGRDLAAALREVSPVSLRLAGPSGKLLVRWDARSSDVLPSDGPRMDAEDARVELARRFLRWLGPGTHQTFARWAGVEPADARATWRALERELVTIEGTAAILADDEEAFARDEPVRGARLLPPGDPFLATERARIVPDDRQRALVWPTSKTNPRLPNGKPFLPGAILLDEEIVGIWARVGTDVTLIPWGTHAAAEIEHEAETMAKPLGETIHLDVVHG